MKRDSGKVNGWIVRKRYLDDRGLIKHPSITQKKRKNHRQGLDWKYQRKDMDEPFFNEYRDWVPKIDNVPVPVRSSFLHPSVMIFRIKSRY